MKSVTVGSGFRKRHFREYWLLASPGSQLGQRRDLCRHLEDEHLPYLSFALVSPTFPLDDRRFFLTEKFAIPIKEKIVFRNIGSEHFSIHTKFLQLIEARF